jgi:hypothetical protein
MNENTVGDTVSDYIFGHDTRTKNLKKSIEELCNALELCVIALDQTVYQATAKAATDLTETHRRRWLS